MAALAWSPTREIIILLQIPHRFFRKEAQKCGSLLPDEGDYGVAMLFLPTDEHGIAEAMRIFEDGCIEEGIPLLFWRDVPIDPHQPPGQAALDCMPTIKQAFLGRPAEIAKRMKISNVAYI